MKSIGFGLERFALLAVVQPWLAAALTLLLLGIAGYGLSKVAFDENLRSVFSGNTPQFIAYANATRQFVDPENELIVLVESDALGEPDSFARLRDFQFELQLIDGVANVFSLFALREPPGETDEAPLIVGDHADRLTPELVDRIRTHPILGAKLLSADAKAMLYVVTPQETGPSLDAPRRIRDEIETVADGIFAGTGTTATITGFPVVRIAVVDTLVRDQRVLNAVGALIGLAMSLIVFRSLTASVMTAVPAVLSGLVIAGGLGAIGVQISVMTNVIPVLVMILGYVDGMHLSRAFRLNRDAGASPAEAAREAIETIGPACILASLTTSVAFLSLVFSDVRVIRDFGWVGAIGCLVGSLFVLMLHSLLAVAIGRFWKERGDAAGTLIGWLGGPSAAIGRLTVDHARSIGAIAFVLVAVLGSMYAAVRPEYSVREHLYESHPTNAALARIDEKLGGSFPVHVILPLGDLDPTSPEALARIGAVHRAVAAVEGVETPLSIWSLVEWLGGTLDAATADRIEKIIEELAPATRQRFYGSEGGTLLSVSIRDAPTAVTEALIDRIETAARGAGGDDVIVTGVTVITAREATRTIANLNFSLMGAIVSGILVILLAFRSWRIAVTSIIPNILPLLGTGALLLLLGRGMQFNGVLALTVAFGIAVDATIHYLNHFFHDDDDSLPLRERLIGTSRRIGPVLFGTTVIIVSGLATTQTSQMPTVALFGLLAGVTLLIGLVGSLVILPALMAGAAKRWFTKDPVLRPAARGAA